MIDESAAKHLFTIGYGGRPPADFLRLLQDHGVVTIVDVRLRPEHAYLSAYAKAKTSDKGIEQLLANANIGYVSFPELGNVFLGWDDWQKPYRQLLAQSGDLLTQRLHTVPRPFCLLCAEKQVGDCHRCLIAEHLARAGWQATHLL